MEFKKDIRFSEKKIDENWKEQAAVNKTTPQAQGAKGPETSKAFLSLVQSLGIQALVHLGAVPNPMSQEAEVNLEAAKETIDALIVLRDKTSGNLSAEEKQFFDGLLSELQVKFSQSV